MDQTLGQRIAEKRRAEGYTQEELAQKLQISAQAISKWENDQTCPDISLLPQLADLLKCSIDELLKGKAKTEALTIVPEKERKPLEQLMLKIIVNSKDGDKIRINLPIALVQAALQMGIELPQFGGKEALKNLDFEQIIRLVEHGAMGKLMEIESADGDTIYILVE